jgi:hypothetical protein
MTPMATIITVATLAMMLGGCQNKLPSEAKEVLFNAFDPEEKPRIDSAKEAELLPEDLALGIEEAWCVNLTFVCWSCSYGEYRTCADSRLAYRIGESWRVFLVVTEEDKEKWEARGCELIPDLVSGY